MHAVDFTNKQGNKYGKKIPKNDSFIPLNALSYTLIIFGCVFSAIGNIIQEIVRLCMQLLCFHEAKIVLQKT